MVLQKNLIENNLQNMRLIMRLLIGRINKKKIQSAFSVCFMQNAFNNEKKR